MFLFTSDFLLLLGVAESSSLFSLTYKFNKNKAQFNLMVKKESTA